VTVEKWHCLILPPATEVGVQTAVLSISQGTANALSYINLCDVTSDGQILSGYSAGSAGNSSSLYLNNPTIGQYQLAVYSNSSSNIAMPFAIHEFDYGGGKYLSIIHIYLTGIGQTTYNHVIYKISPTTIPVRVYFYSGLSTTAPSYMSSILSGASATRCILRKTMTYNGEIYLLDTPFALSTTSTTKSAVKLVPDGITFIPTGVNIYNPSVFGRTGNATVSANDSTVSINDATPTPTVMIAAGAANTYMRIK